jgi:RNA polymerase sigma-70 factor (ECF subfamily)
MTPVQKIGSVSSSSTAIPRQRQEKGEPTEAEIIRLAQNGDAAAFEHLYRAHSRRVYALCQRMTGNPSLAEDLTQEAFLQVFRKIQSFRGESAFSSWLYRLTFNLVLMNQRVKRLNETSLEERHLTEDSTVHTREFGRSNPRVFGVAERVTLKGALSQLPRGYRQIFFLHDVLGYEHHEIAEVLGCAIGTSKSQLHKARMQLRRILDSGNSTNLIPETAHF